MSTCSGHDRPRRLTVGARCRSGVTGLPQDHAAEGFLGPAGRMTGPAVSPSCAECAAEVIKEYREKLGEGWEFTYAMTAGGPLLFWHPALDDEGPALRASERRIEWAMGFLVANARLVPSLP